MTPTNAPLRIGHLSTFYHTALPLMSPAWPGTPVDAEWALFPTGPAMMEAFRGGRLDAGYIGLPPAMIGMARGVPIRCVAGGHVEGTVLIGLPHAKTLEDAGGSLAATLAQFRGGAIGTPAGGSIHDVIVRHLLRKEGLEEDVEVKNFVQADLLPDALVNEELVAAAGTPALAVAGRHWVGSKLLVPADALWPNNPSYGIVARQGFIDDSPAALEAFLRAHEEATHLLRTRPREAAALTAGVVAIIDEGFVRETYGISPKYCGALPPAYIEATMAFVPTLQEFGYLDRPLPANGVFETRFLPRFHPEPPHYEEAGAHAR